MRLILIGNGIEIEFQPALRKEQIIKNALEGKIPLDTGGMIKSQFPLAIQYFAKKYKLSIANITDLDWNEIKKHLQNEQENKSIEKIFMDIELAIESQEGRNEIREIFLKYLDVYSNQIDISQFDKLEKIGVSLNQKNNEIDKVEELKINILKDKLDNYDLILTTNYTNFLKRNLESGGKGNSKNKIIYLHGEYNNEENPPLLGREKTLDEENTIDTIIKNLEEGFLLISPNLINKRKVILDIYGWSFDNEVDLIKYIIYISISYIVQNKVLQKDIRNDDYKKHFKKSSEKKINFNPQDSDKYVFMWKQDIASIEIEINYYYYDQKDKINFENYINSQEWIQKNLIELELSAIPGQKVVDDNYKIEMGFFKKYFLSEKIIMSLFQKASFKYINLKINNDDIQKEKENMEDFINEITVEKESGLSFNK